MIVINCTQIESKQQLHEVLAARLHFPDYYGKNLDALMDCLTEIGQETAVCFMQWNSMGDWKDGFKETFADACRENPVLSVEYL